jgi:hypothetical protein
VLFFNVPHGPDLAILPFDLHFIACRLDRSITSFALGLALFATGHFTAPSSTPEKICRRREGALCIDTARATARIKYGFSSGKMHTARSTNKHHEAQLDRGRHLDMFCECET